MNQEKKQKLFLWSMIAFFAVTIVPLLAISWYDHPSADDYAYAVDTYRVWRSTGNLFSVLKEAVKTSADYWNHWQGLYTSAFLLALEPGLFGEQYYRVTGFLTIGTVVIGNLAFCGFLLHRKFGETKLTAAAFGMALSFLMLHFMPSAAEGLYWYNGAMNYTFFYGILLLLLCAVLALCEEQKLFAAARRLLFAVFLAVVLSGGNHVTAFTGLLAVSLILGCCVIFRKKSFSLRVGIVLFFEAVGFCVNILSPGTKVRADAFEQTGGIVSTLWNALRYLLGQMNDWIGLALIVVLVLLLPSMHGCVKRLRMEKNFHFRCPLAVFVASVGLLTAMCCPSYYAMGAIGAGRLVNVIYFAFVLLVFVNAFYVCGWVDETFQIARMQQTVQWSVTVAVLCFGMVVGCCDRAAGFIALSSIRSGEALAYSMEADARYNLYLESEGQDVEVAAFSFYPRLLYYEDITQDPSDWRNCQVEEYFGLKSVVRK